jgi:hypothetical protein
MSPEEKVENLAEMQETKTVSVTPTVPTQVPEGKVVWIACRAHENCPGNHAVMLSTRTVPPAPGQFIPTQGARSVRYRCTTCNGVFSIMC